MQAILDSIQKLTQPEHRPLIIAISGFGGSGKSTLANKLKLLLKDTETVTIDSFSIHEWRRSADWDNYDRDRFMQEILKPARTNRFPLVYADIPWPGYVENAAAQAPQSAYLIVEGCSIFHPDLIEFYDFKIWMNCQLEEATSRAIWRDRHIRKDEQDDLWLNIWMPNDRDFFYKYRPDKVADATINIAQLSYNKCK